MKTTKLTTFGKVSVVVALGLSALPAAAQTYFLARTEAGATTYTPSQGEWRVNDGTGYIEGALPISPQSSAVDRLGSGLEYGRANAWSRSGIAGIHLSASAFSKSGSLDPDPLNVGYVGRTTAGASAEGRFSDDFTLNVPNYAPGAMFTVTGLMRIDGVASGSGELAPQPSTDWSSNARSNSIWTSEVTITNGTLNLVTLRDKQECWGSERVADTRCVGTSPGWRTFSFAMPNQSWSAKLWMSAMVGASTSTNLIGGGEALAYGAADLGNTIAWSGITELRDASGQLISDFSAISATSGFDYRNAYVSAVPIPAAAWLFGSGLLGLIGVTRRKIRHRG